jgi:hypothetical protein
MQNIISNIIGTIIRGFNGSSIPSDSVLEPDGITALREPNNDIVLEP